MTRLSASKAAPAKTSKTSRQSIGKAAAAVKRTAAAAKPVKPVKAPAVKSKAAPAEKGGTPPEMAASKPAAKSELKENKEKPRKIKLVRDSFTMPETEYAALGEVKKACLKAGIEVKKSELLRVGVALIRQLDTTRLKEILAGLPTLKAGRPKKSK